MGADAPIDKSQGLPEDGRPKDDQQAPATLEPVDVDAHDPAVAPADLTQTSRPPSPAPTAQAASANSELTRPGGIPVTAEPGRPAGAAQASPPPPERPVPPPPPAVRTPPPPKPAKGPCPPGRGSRSGCLIAIAVAVVVALVASIAVIVFLGKIADLLPDGAAALPVGVDGRLRKEVVLDGALGSEREIVVIDVRGMILYNAPFDGASSRLICSQLKAVRKDDDVVGVILDMNTPGGEVTASDEIHRAMLQVRDAGKPVVTCMHAMGASGGYLIAAGTDCIVANRLSLTGSIGVLIGTLNYSGLFEKIGLESEIYKSGKMKDLLNGGRPRTDSERAFVNQLVKENFHAFAQIVADGRERYSSLEDVLAAEFADGRVLSGAQALELGLVDQLGYFDDAVAKARELADAPDAKVVRLRRGLRFSDLLMSLKAPQLGALRSLLPEEIRSLQPGRFYYLAPTVLE